MPWFAGQCTPSLPEELCLCNEVATPSTRGSAHVQPLSWPWAEDAELLSPHSDSEATLPRSGLWNPRGERAALLGVTPGHFGLSLQLVSSAAGAERQSRVTLSKDLTSVSLPRLYRPAALGSGQLPEVLSPGGKGLASVPTS